MFERTASDDKNKRFAVETEQDGALGIATLYGIDRKNRCATHGIKLVNKERKTKGIRMDTVMAIPWYALDELGLHRLNGSWFDENVPSKNLYTKCGWKVEGIKRECVFKRGAWRDVTMVGV